MAEQQTTKKPFLPPRWVIHLAWRIHRGLYRGTGGRLGLRRPKPDRWGMMWLIATGRRTGKRRGVPLAYIEDGTDLITLAMNGWGRAEPAWWLNLQADPEVEVVLVDGPRLVTARAADPRERERLWDTWRGVDPELDAFAALRPTETAVVILSPRP